MSVKISLDKMSTPKSKQNFLRLLNWKNTYSVPNKTNKKYQQLIFT